MLEKSADYVLIMHHALRHVGHKLEGAAPAALSFSDLTKGYDHPNPSDLSRVKKWEHIENDNAAKAWVIRYAVTLLDGGLNVDGDMVSFAPGKGYDDLKWLGDRIERPGPDIHAKLRNPFDPMNGVFSDNIREEIGDLSELRESMKAWGWIDRPQFRGIGNARSKVILVGHRRITVAKELGIDWESHVDWIDFGDGDAADAERLKLAIASNIGAKKLGPNDRKRIAAHLYGDQGWTMQQIADALEVAKMTVSRDLESCNTVLQPSRPKGGRPKGKKPFISKVEQTASIKVELDKEIEPLLKEGLSRAVIAKQLGVGEKVVQFAQQRYVGRMQERKAQAVEHPCTCPVCGHQHPKGGTP